MSSGTPPVDPSIAEISRNQWEALGGDPRYLAADFVPGRMLSATHSVSQLGAATFATVGSAVAELLGSAGHPVPSVTVDLELASGWLQATPSRPIGWVKPTPWHDVSADYPTADGRWIRLQANYAHLRQAVADTLGVPVTREAFGAAIIGQDADVVEQALVDGGGAVAATHSIDEWAAHPQGIAVAAEPLVDTFEGTAADVDWTPLAERPLSGIRILDITRVLAGPLGTRFLAGLGAEVLRIDPPNYYEPDGGSGGDLISGKRAAILELDTEEGRRVFLELLAGADVFVHGLRADALEKLGLGPDVLAAVRPGLIDVALNAYGWTGPWNARRGFDTLVQTSAGFSTEKLRRGTAPGPQLLPVQVLDIATGYLIASSVIRGLTRRLTTGKGSSWRLSLARTARYLSSQEEEPAETALALPVNGPVEPFVFRNPSGPVRRLVPPVTIGGVPLFWEYPGDAYGTSNPVWASRHGNFRSSKEN